jgi:hypothetical protein
VIVERKNGRKMEKGINLGGEEEKMEKQYSLVFYVLT